MLAIRAGRLIDGTGADPLNDAMVLVDGGRIAAVGPASEVVIPSTPDIRRIDARRHTLLPGMIDAHVHVHVTGDDRNTALSDTHGMLALRSYAFVRQDLEMGFTTLRSLSSPHYVDIALRDAIDRGVVQGPRLRVSGQGITATGGHMDTGRRLSPDVSLGGMTGVANGPWECRRAAREQIKRGADVIKINACVGNVEDLASPWWQELTYEEMAAICEQAHWFNRRVAAHTSGGPGITDAIRAGVDSLEHAHWLTDAQLDMMAEAGTFYVPTLICNDRCTAASQRDGALRPDKVRAWLEKVCEEKWETVRRAKAAGVKIVAGTDAGCLVHHGENALEIEALAKAGLTPMEAIRAATEVAAACLDMSAEIGTVEAGKLGDLVIVDGDPLADLRVLQDRDRIVHVIKGGEIIR